MPRSKHYYSAAEPRRMNADLAGEAKAAAAADDRLLSLSLSLGDIYRNNAPAARSPDAGAFLSPVLVAPTAPAPKRRVVALGATPSPPAVPPMVHPPPPLLLDALVGQGCSAFTPVVIRNAPTTPPTPLSHHKPSGDGGIGSIPTLPARGDDEVTTPRAPRKRSRSGRCCSSATTKTKIADDETVEIEGGLHVSPPYAWSTERVGVHHTLAELSNRGVKTITGELQCKRCGDVTVMEVDLEAKFRDLCGYISRNIHGMDDRAPQRWKEPALPDCGKCGQRGSMRPVIPADKHRINWVFLLLTEMLGVCTLEQLKHLCAHTRQHRTGAKDRVLYSTYMELCNQLMPDGIFDMASERQKRARPNAY